VTDAIVAEELRKRYKTVQALDGLSFSVREGEVFGLLGPNGAGKSTTVRVLTTLTRPDSGRARVAGEDVIRHPDRVRRLIGYVAQDSGVDWEATGRENLLLQGRIHGLSGRALRARVDELLELVGLVEAADRQARGYSGGMKRRLDVATGLVHRPRVLFLDEPTTGLDPEARAAMWEEVERLAAQESLTILLTTHYLEEADRLAERVAIVSRGKVVVEGRPEELKAGLRGDSVTVELGEQDDRVEAAAELVRGLAGASAVSIEGRSVRTRVPNGAQAIPVILAALESGGFPVAAVTTSRPSLDDVYLHYTGRDFASEDAAGSLAGGGGEARPGDRARERARGERAP
jgi:ABC-2 type transport system ATP-binding protein